MVVSNSGQVSRRAILVAAGVAMVTGVRVPAVAATSRAQRSHYTVPAELADGRDASAELTAWLMELPNGARASLGGLTYRIESFVKLEDRVDLTICNGSLLRTVKSDESLLTYPNANPFIWLVRPTGCAVVDVVFRGTNTVSDLQEGFGSYLVKYEFDAAIRADELTDLTIRRIDVDGIWGDGVQLHSGSHARIINCKIDRVGRQGVSIIASHVLCDQVRILHGRRSGFDLEPNLSTDVIEDIEIRNCWTFTRLLPFASGGAGQVNDVYLHDNISTGAAVPVLYVRASDGARRANWRFEDHTAIDPLGSPLASVEMHGIDGLVVRGVDMNIVEGRGGAFSLVECGSVCAVRDSNWHGASNYSNTDPLADQRLTVVRNTPNLVELQ